jgi:hypothetical protein
MRITPFLTTAALALAVPVTAAAAPPAVNPNGKPNPGAENLARKGEKPSKPEKAEKPAKPEKDKGTAPAPVPTPAPAPAPAPSPAPADPTDPAAPTTPGAPGTDPEATEPDGTVGVTAVRVVGPNASAKAKTKAYGTYCKAESRKRVAGSRSTPFSLCVTALARVAKNDAAPGQACRALSRRKVPGTAGSPFSLCVKAAKKLRTPVPAPTTPEDPAPTPEDPVAEPQPTPPDAPVGTPEQPVETPAA